MNDILLLASLNRWRSVIELLIGFASADAFGPIRTHNVHGRFERGQMIGFKQTRVTYSLNL